MDDDSRLSLWGGGVSGSPGAAMARSRRGTEQDGLLSSLPPTGHALMHTPSRATEDGSFTSGLVARQPSIRRSSEQDEELASTRARQWKAGQQGSSSRRATEQDGDFPIAHRVSMSGLLTMRSRRGTEQDGDSMPPSSFLDSGNSSRSLQSMLATLATAGEGGAPPQGAAAAVHSHQLQRQRSLLGGGGGGEGEALTPRPPAGPPPTAGGDLGSFSGRTASRRAVRTHERIS